jgi:uncharacterized membrane protein
VIALTFALLLLALFVLLPLMTSLRLLRMSRDVEELKDRLEVLEAELRQRPVAPSVSPTSPWSAPAAAADETPRTIDAVVSIETDTATTSVPPAPPSAAAEAPFAAATAVEDDLEERIGGRWLLYTGVLVLLLGVSFFLKYAFDNEWITETGRVVAGILAGMALIAGGARLATHGLANFGQALIGTGLAVLYLSIYAALTFYALIGPTAAFSLMFAVTVGAAVLADWQRAQALAFIAVGGGFLTPFLVGGTEDAHLTLFTYDALLIAGTMLLARRHDWVALNALSYLFTLATVAAWAGTHYRDRLWLRTVLFLTLYCVMFLQILRETRRAPTGVARAVALLLATAPLFYHVAAVVLTAQHPPAIHIYLIAFAAVGLWLTAEPHRPALRLLVLLASYIPLFGDLTLPDGLSWTAANTVTIVAVAALHLLAPLDRVLRQEQRLARSELFALHAVLIGVYALLHETLARSYPQLRGAIGLLVAMVALGLWRKLQTRDHVASLNAIAIAFTLTAIAMAVQLDGPAVVVGWTAEAGAAVWIGLRLASPWLQLGGLGLWVLAVVRLLDGYFDTPVAFVAIFNIRAAITSFVVLIGYAMAWLYAKHRDEAVDYGRARAALHVGASVVTMIWITAEVSSYWAVRYTTTQAYFYEQATLSLAWASYGALLIIVGMRRSYAPDRYIGITVLGVTILKVFFVDLWELDGIYRVVAFIVFGVVLVAVSYLYQKRKSGVPPLTRQDTADSQI